MRGTATRVLSGALLMVGALLAGCSAAGPNAAGWTVQPGSGGAGATVPSSAGAPASAPFTDGADTSATPTTACELRNIVRGPAGKGDYSFGDVVSVKAFAPDEKVAPAKAFDTLDQAARYAFEGSEFANVQRMLMSLEINN